ncbi:mucin-2-like [Macrobrachium nipponense]|uniref:mucin-2-like n=1 Tax=Macrobrachium nipponense TaxID=159736 RepID=UPI0030C88FE3
MAGATGSVVVMMKVLLEMCFVALIIISSGPRSTEAVTTITQATVVTPEISALTSTTNKTIVDNPDSNSLLSSNITETNDTTTTTSSAATSHGQEKESVLDDTAVNAILDKPTVPVTGSSLSVNTSSTHRKSNDKVYENNSTTSITVNKVSLTDPTDPTEKGENTAAMNNGPSTNDSPSGRPDEQFGIDTLPLKAETVVLQNTPSTTVPPSPQNDSDSDMTTEPPTEDMKHSSTHELGAYNLTRPLSTVATALGKDTPTAASASTIPSGLIFIIVLVALVLVEVGLVNFVNWWKDRDTSWNGERRYFSFLFVLFNRKSTRTTYAGPIDDTTPIVQEA